MINKTISATALIFMSIAIVSCKSEPTAPVAGSPGGPPIAIEGFIAKKTEVNDFVEAPGSVIPGEEVEVKSEISAIVTNLPMKEGAFVKKGDLIAKLFDADLVAQKTKLSAQLELARETAKRLAALNDKNGISRQEYDQAVLQVQLLEAELKIIDVNISRTEIRAPFDGVLGLRNVSVGTLVSPSLIITTLRSLNPMKLDFSIPEKYSSLIQPNMNVTFTLQGSSENFTAKVIATERSIDIETRNLSVRAVIESKNEAILPGAFADVKVPVAVNKPVLMIPTQSIIPQAREKSVIVNRNGVAQFVKVTTGIRKESFIEIIDGIQEGDTVATTGVLFLKPNAPFKFSKIQ
jgi:membrane fusion protein (multidrug efflux system)